MWEMQAGDQHRTVAPRSVVSGGNRDLRRLAVERLEAVSEAERLEDLARRGEGVGGDHPGPRLDVIGMNAVQARPDWSAVASAPPGSLVHRRATALQLGGRVAPSMVMSAPPRISCMTLS